MCASGRTSRYRSRSNQGQSQTVSLPFGGQGLITVINTVKDLHLPYTRSGARAVNVSRAVSYYQNI